MGVVYKARDPRLGRFVALKLFHTGAVADRERRLRFLQEAKAASALNHPNIVTVYDIGDSEEGPFLAMECVSGETLASIISGKPLAIGEALKYAVQTMDALAAAHAAGIVHRDVKPANLMVTRQGQVKVLDFGLARMPEPPPRAATAAATASTVTERPHTREGALMGTVAYMSPEQAEGRLIDARSDIFSFGVVLYEMITGQRPFRGDSKLATVTSILRDDPRSPSLINSAVPLEVERVTVRCLEKDPARRFQHAGDLKIALEWLSRDAEAGKLGAANTPKGRPSARHKLLGPLAILGAGVAIAARSIGRGGRLTSRRRRRTWSKSLTITP